MKTLLVNPHPKTGGQTVMTGLCEPLGLLYVASVLEQHGIEVEVVDGAAEGLDHEGLESRIAEFNPGVIGIACMMTETYPDSVEATKTARRAAPNARIIMGGHSASFMADKIIENLPEVDHVVVGEGELTFLELVRSLSKGGDIGGVKGVMYRNNGRATFTGTRERVQNLDGLPFPARHLVPNHYGCVELGGHRIRFKNFSAVLTTRGCPFGCTFCSCTAFSGRQIRARSPENVAKELEYLIEERGVKHVFFVDDTFTLLPKRAMEICRLIKQRGLDFEWFCEGRVDTASEEMYNAMAEAGCWLILFGIESGSQRILDYYGKKTTVEMGRRAVALAQKAGLEVIGSFIVGAPIEDDEDYQKTLDFILSADMDLVNMNSLKVLQGTELWKQFEASGAIGPEDWNRYFWIFDLCENHSKEGIYAWMRRAEKEFYRRPGYIIKQLGRTLTRRMHLFPPLVRGYL